MGLGLANPQVEVNGLSVAIVPNSFSFTEGFGEQSVKTQSAGGQAVEEVFFDNAETKLSMVKFELYNTDENIALTRIFKANTNGNLITWTGGTKSDTVRAVRAAALTNDYEVNLKNEGLLSLEFHGRSAI